MSNKVDEILNKIRQQPVFSGLSAVFGSAATVDFLAFNTLNSVTLGVYLTSPLVSVGLGIAAGVNLFRDRSKLSKAFSAAAAVTATLGLVLFADQSTVPEGGGLLAPLFTTIGMTVAGVFGLAAHYTRNMHHATQVTTNPPQDKSPTISPQ